MLNMTRLGDPPDLRGATRYIGDHSCIVTLCNFWRSIRIAVHAGSAGPMGGSGRKMIGGSPPGPGNGSGLLGLAGVEGPQGAPKAEGSPESSTIVNDSGSAIASE
jgi:hypothetical protein